MIIELKDGKFQTLERKYGVIYADPPWQFNNKNTGGSMKSGSANQYDVMSLADICELPVQDICKPDCFLFMWWVASMPIEALAVVDAWGFELKTMTAFSWIKKTVNGKDHFGMGHYTRQQQEKVLVAGRGCVDVIDSDNVLIARRGKAKVHDHSVRQNVRAPVGRHSEKPDEVRHRIDRISNMDNSIELFARKDPGMNWDCFGNEIQMRFEDV